MRKYLYSVVLSFCVLFLGIHQGKGQITKNLKLNKYSNETEITAIEDIDLLPGFEIPEGKTVNIFTGINFDNWVALSSKPSTDQNYILSRVFRRAGIKTDTDANSNDYNTAEVNQTIQYFDGLGRPLQTVMVQASPKFYDVVQPVTYDAFGREDKKYQPYVIESNGGTYRTDALKDLKDFYANPGSGIAVTAYPYGQTVFEPSPLNRIVEQGAPGADWQPVSGSNTGHTQKIEYGTNADEVKLWTVTADGVSGTTNYLAGKLYKTTSKDENWKTTDLKAGTTDEYTDFDGHIIMKRVWETDKKGLSTYYVYDDLGNLCYVLPPAVNENGHNTVSSFKESDDVFKQFIYGYHYDGRKRLVEKKLPGKNWEYLVYNVLDQVVLTQDANQRAINQWVFTKYDEFGRVVGSGQYADASKRDAIQATVNKQTVLWETRKTNDTGYDNLSFPQTASLADYYVINYYDDYSFPGVGTADQPSGNQVGAERVKSLLTGTRVRILGTGTMLSTIHYYDTEGRMVQSKVENHLGGKDIIDNTYNFVGELMASNRSHKTKSNTVTIANRYFYDHLGRKIATTENINGLAEVVLNKLDYTETGRLLSKQLHSTNNGGSYLQQTTYDYNERGWQTKSMGDQFNLQLKYNDGDVPQWNGNIANQLWGRSKGSLDNTFAYSYDPLNRLTKAVSPGLGESISYDVMGNIKTLDREGKGINTYGGYIGNQLTKITGFTNSEYSYDDNGNLTYDKEKNINLTYNYLNLPQTITGSQNLSYTYDATGNKLKKTSSSETTDYIRGVQYTNGVIDVVATEEGQARNNQGNYSYEYNLSDHLGNVRMTFNKHPVENILAIQQSDDYYAFGLRKNSKLGSNKYLYNSKELQEELGEYDYGARFYDPVLGRWNVVDPKAQLLEMTSPYVYALNSPSSFIDKDGELPIYIGGKTNYDSERNSKSYWNAQLLSTIAGSGIPNPGHTALFVDGNRYLYRLANVVEVRRATLLEGEAEEGRVNAGYEIGKADFKRILAQLERDPKTGKITEKIQIYTHSRGAAFGIGYTNALLEMIKENSREFADAVNEIDFVYNMSPHGAGNITSPEGVNEYSHHHDRDKLSSDGMKGVAASFSSNEKEPDGFFAAHANGSFIIDVREFLKSWQNSKGDNNKLINDFVARMRALGIKVTVN